MMVKVVLAGYTLGTLRLTNSPGDGMCPAGTGAFHSFIFGRLRGGRRCVGLRTGALKITKQGLSFERWFLCPAGTGAFLFCCLGRLRRGQGGAGYGAAPPSRPPLHPPRSTPLGFSSFRHFARAARLLLRELPRCARRSPFAPRNARERFRVE